MKPIYRVVKHTKYERCEIKKEYFTIQKQFKFLGLKWWKTFKAHHMGWEYNFKENMTFDTESDAIYAIKKLENGSIADGWVSQVSTVLDFNRGNKMVH